MISYATIQHAYNDLYVEVRKYLWEFPAVEALADLELACYQACPDLDNVRRQLSRFKSYARCVDDDKDLNDAISAFEDILSDADETFVKLTKLNEVVQ